MNLKGKKRLIARTLKVGVGRIKLDPALAEEVKEAITRSDIKDLQKKKVIKIKEIGGRKRLVKRKTKRRKGSIKKRIGTRKQDYVKITRKLRGYVKKLKIKGQIDKKKYRELNKKIKAGEFRDFSHLNSVVKEILK